VGIATLAKYYGLNVSIAKLREISGTDKNGNNTMSLVYTFEKLGFESEALRLNDEAIFEFEKIPAMFQIIKNETHIHYAVVYSITEDLIIYSDPSEGIIKCKPEEFFSIWTNIVITAVPGDNFIKGDMTPNFLIKFFSLILGQKKVLIKIFFYSIFYSFFCILGIYLYKLLMDKIVFKEDLNYFKYLFIGFIILNIFKLIINVYKNKLKTKLDEMLDFNILIKYYSHIMYLPLSFFESRNPDEIKSKFEDTIKIRECISDITFTLMTDLLIIISALILLGRYNILLTSVLVLNLILHKIIVFIFSKPVENTRGKIFTKKNDFSLNIYESIMSIETIKSANKQDIFINNVKEKFTLYLKAKLKYINLKLLKESFIKLLNVLSFVAILWIASFYVLESMITIGELILFILICVYFIEHVSNLMKIRQKIKSVVYSADKVGEILDLKTEKEAQINDLNLSGYILIKNVSFRFGLRRKVLENINLNIKKGEKVAIVGESGSGKSTLAKLLISLYNLQEGNIIIDGYDIKNISYKNLRESIAYVSQDIFLFNKSIRENLLCGKNISEVDFNRITKLTKCDEFVNKLPLKYDTVVTEGNSLISNGQRQRLVIARALLENPEILILDEATGYLDTKTESAIINSIFNILKERTTIVISYKLNIISRCDKIVVMDNGKIMEIGTHDTLISKRGRYFEMWDLLDRE
jgi:ATP-binding cassette subfamily B protein